jgi:uncharacterized protein YbjT (DUF2867 family)
MSGKKTIVVFGGTGGQGGSVIKALLKDPKMMEVWKIRAITRDVSKPAAKALEEKGVEVISVGLPVFARISLMNHADMIWLGQHG